MHYILKYRTFQQVLHGAVVKENPYIMVEICSCTNFVKKSDNWVLTKQNPACYHKNPPRKIGGIGTEKSSEKNLKKLLTWCATCDILSELPLRTAASAL